MVSVSNSYFESIGSNPIKGQSFEYLNLVIYCKGS